jgi:hypothetical protein
VIYLAGGFALIDGTGPRKLEILMGETRGGVGGGVGGEREQPEIEGSRDRRTIGRTNCTAWTEHFRKRDFRVLPEGKSPAQHRP